MAGSGFSDTLASFVRAHLSSVEQVEVLLLLHRTAPRRWTAVATSRELRLDPVSVARRLSEFHEHGILAVVPGAEALEYWYEPSPAAPPRTLSELGTAYRDRRTSLINLIFAAPVDDARAFADAFRLRKREE